MWISEILLVRHYQKYDRCGIAVFEMFGSFFPQSTRKFNSSVIHVWELWKGTGFQNSWFTPSNNLSKMFTMPIFLQMCMIISFIPCVVMYSEHQGEARSIWFATKWFLKHWYLQWYFPSHNILVIVLLEVCGEKKANRILFEFRNHVLTGTLELHQHGMTYSTVAR